jgi:hypothetical protein
MLFGNMAFILPQGKRSVELNILATSSSGRDTFCCWKQAMN